MGRPLILGLALICGQALGAAGASEHPACARPFSGSANLSPDALYAIAASCRDENVAALFRARAEHRELSNDLEMMSRLISYGYAGSSDRLHLEQSRIYVGLIEAFAGEAWARGDTGAVTSARLGYQDAVTLVEAAIQGRDLALGRR